MSFNRTNPKAGFASQKELKRGPNGRCLCRRCEQEVPAGRRTFCGEVCVHEHKLRSNPGYLRLCVFKRDRGICLDCGRDCHAIEKQLNELHYHYSAKNELKHKLKSEGFDLHRSTFWDAEHVKPVIEGGGECGLDNIVTVCQPCHKVRTRALAAKRAAERKRTQSDDAACRGVRGRVTDQILVGHEGHVLASDNVPGTSQVPQVEETPHPGQVGEA